MLQNIDKREMKEHGLVFLEKKRGLRPASLNDVSAALSVIKSAQTNVGLAVEDTALKTS